MFKNYLKVAFRNLIKQKGYSFINIAGLAIGMAACILIALYIKTELSFDRYHENSDNIYRLTAILTLGGKPNPIASTNYPPAKTIVEDYPEAINWTRFVPRRKLPVKYGDKQFYEEKIFYSENSTFDIFSFPMLQGNPKTALTAPFTVVITQTVAVKYFGNENPIGRKITLNNNEHYTVTGVIENVPDHSHFTFDFLCAWETLKTTAPERVEAWTGAFGCYGYIQLQEGADYKELDKKFPAMIEKYMGEGLRKAGPGVDVAYYLQPLTDIHLHSHLRHELSGNSDILYVYIFSVVAALILLMACINFMNLSTARSVKRAREIGIRKVMGSSRSRLITQFYGEALFYGILSMIFSLVIVHLTLPLFSALSQRNLNLNYLDIPWSIPVLLGLALLVGFVAGSYPALFLSALPPIKTLQENTPKGKSQFRKILVVSQFTISISLIIGTSLIISQLDYMKNKDLGFDKEQVVVVPIMDRSLASSIEMIKNELKKLKGVINVTASSHIPGKKPSGGIYTPEGYENGQTQMMNGINVDADFFETLKMEIVQGRAFSSSFPADPEEAIIINEAAAGAIGWDQPLGKHITRTGMSKAKTIVGVVKDFHFSSPHRTIAPLYISCIPNPLRAVFVRIQPDAMDKTISRIKNKWLEFDPNRPFDYQFLDESFDTQYRVEEKLSRVFSNFTFIALLISCLGLFGLASYSAEQKTREIGIRKVMGASVWQIVTLLSKEFTKWVLIANIAAFPIAWFAVHHWLQNFAYRIHVQYYLFIAAAILSLLIALITVSFQALKAAVANPVESLRYE